MFCSAKSWTRGIFLSCTIVGAMSAARAEVTPPTLHPGVDTSSEAVESIHAPAAIQDETAANPAPVLVTREAPSTDPLDKGSSFTDGGDGLPSSTPNALEMQKLEMARAAVEASRLAGTLYPAPQEEIDPPALSESELDAIKMEQLRAIEPIVLPPDPVTMVGIEVPPVEITGPQELNAAEAAKLIAPLSPYAPAPATPAVPPSSETGKEIH